MAIVVARQFDEFSRTLSKAGFSVINCPTIRTVPLDDLTELEEKLEQLNDFDGVFLTSRRGSAIFRERYRRAAIPFVGKVFVFGRRSFTLLKHEGLDLYTDDSAGTVAEMLSQIPLAYLRRKRFLVVCGERSLSSIPDFLGPLAKVEKVPAYRTIAAPIPPSLVADIQSLAESDGVEFFCFFSPSGADSFGEQLGWSVLKSAKIAAIGETTADYFRRHDVEVGFVAPKPAAKEFAHALIDSVKQSRSVKSLASSL